MNINGYKKNKYYCNKKKLNNNCCNNNFNLNTLFEIEHFLCTLKNISKGINLYKLFK